MGPADRGANVPVPGVQALRVRVRPRFAEALRTAREVKAHTPHCRVVFTAYGTKRLGRDAAELTALAVADEPGGVLVPLVQREAAGYEAHRAAPHFEEQIVRAV